MLHEYPSNRREHITEERLEKAFQVLASIVADHGEQHKPLLHMIEGQLEELRIRKTSSQTLQKLVAVG